MSLKIVDIYFTSALATVNISLEKHNKLIQFFQTNLRNFLNGGLNSCCLNEH